MHHQNSGNYVPIRKYLRNTALKIKFPQHKNIPLTGLREMGRITGLSILLLLNLWTDAVPKEYPYVITGKR